MERKYEIANRIKTMRMSRNMTQADLASTLNVGQSTVAMWETAQREPGFEMLDFMADVFNVPLYALIYSEREIAEQMNTPPLSIDERRLLAAYRHADAVYQVVAVEILESHHSKEKENLA